MKKETTEKKTLIASWLVYASKGKNPFRVIKLGTGRKFCMRRDGDLVQYAWHFSTRKKARDFAWQMNAAAHYALD